MSELLVKKNSWKYTKVLQIICLMVQTCIVKWVEFIFSFIFSPRVWIQDACVGGSRSVYIPVRAIANNPVSALFNRHILVSTHNKHTHTKFPIAVVLFFVGSCSSSFCRWHPTHPCSDCTRLWSISPFNHKLNSFGVVILSTWFYFFLLCFPSFFLGGSQKFFFFFL